MDEVSRGIIAISWKKELRENIILFINKAVSNPIDWCKFIAYNRNWGLCLVLYFEFTLWV